MRVGNYNKCNKRRQKQGLIGLFVVTLLVVGIAVALIVIGYNNNEDGQDLKENSTLEECEIFETKLSDCDSTQKGSTIPDYILIAPDKCGYNTTLTQAEGNEIGCTLNEDVKSMNQTYSCYVHDECGYYSFDQYSTLTDDGSKNIYAGIAVLSSILFVWILVGGICLCMGCGRKKYSDVNANIDE
mmetsp:Transcript_37033/g.32735  ORF Transcript_37033/g.32735 Transcript_37033/m.32735 type:complete len:185 (-) Transcript_37033:155-709(-)